MHALPFAVMVAVSAAPASPPQLKIATPGLTGVHVTDREAAFFSEHLAQQLAAAGAKVTSDREISAVLGLERKRQLLGCSENSSQCLTELAGALGVDALMVGDVARLQQHYQVNVKLLSVASASLIGAESERADTDEQLVDALTAIAGRLARRGAERLSRSLVPEGKVADRVSGPSLPVLPIVLAGAGVLAGGFGGFAAVQANTNYERLTSATDEPTARQLRDDGVAWRTATQVGLGAGAAALVGAAALLLLGGSSSPPAVALSATPQGAGVALRWSWP
ncbi:MAG TPA: hypothetical protein VND93_23680 [Myxococcales bacterium]|nr:hypothetical protein [Myxococcales bacterium]